jgi:hypothetical protein
MARFTGAGSGNNGGAALNYVQVEGTPQTISSAPNSIVDLNITTTGAPVQISVTGEGANASAGSWLRLNLFRDNVEIGNAIQMESSAASENVPFAINFIDDVEAGTYNYSARVTTITGGNWVFGEADGPVINAVELTGFKGDRGLRGLTGAPGADGAAGTDGTDGADGEDGADGASAYDIAVANGFVGTEQEWLDSFGGTADIADFMFTFTPEDVEEEVTAKSVINIHNHDMRIETTRDGGQDSDISIDSADDVWITANDSVEITSTTDEVRIYTGADGTNNWIFQEDGGLRFPDQTVQTTAYTGDGGFSLEPYGDIFGDSEPAGENRVVNLSYTFSEGPINGTPVAIDNNNALFVPINNEAFEDLISYQINSQLSDLSVTLNDQTVLSVSGFSDGVYLVNEQEFPAGIVVLNDYITKTAEEIYPFVLTATRTYPGVTNSVTISVSSEVDPDADWVFDSDGNLITPVGSPRIVNPAVPGDITLSAYSGIELSFADVEGAGLKFPDNTVQTTAYTGGAGADTGDITFVDNTISSDTGDDIVIENKNDDGIVKARITLDQSNEQVRIEAIASDSEWFNDTQWSTAVWSGSVVSITNSTDIINFFDNVAGETTRVSINNGGLLTYEGASFGGGNITINVGGTPPDGQGPLTVTEIRFYYALVSEINIDHDDSEFNIISRGMSMTIDSSGDLDLKARDSDLHLYANDDVRFTTNWDNNGTEYSWRMSESGKFELPGDGYIENPVNSSGDGNAYDTIKIVPDADLLENSIFTVDQYIIIDPTGPNHIHIRAGGEIDSSGADLILGGERNQVLVSDTSREVKIGTASQETINTYLNTNTENSTLFITDMSADISYGAIVNIDGLDFTVDSITGDTPSAGLMTVSAGGATFTAGQTYTFVFDGNGDNEWTFGTDGYLYGPVNGNLGVASIYGLPNTPLEVDSQHSVVLKGYNGEYLNGISSENQIATIGDLMSAGPSETSFAVNGGTLGTQPTFDGAPLFSGTYVINGPMVHFQIQVDMDNILTFGDGQYFIDLPFPAKYGYQFKEGCLHDISSGKQYAIGGHVYAGQSQMALTFTNSAGQDEAFDYNSPVVLATTDNFHISGTYISE